MQRFTSHVDWACPSCDHYNTQEVEVPELNFQAEKSRDMSVHADAELTCDSCDTTFTGTVFVTPGDAQFEMTDPKAFDVDGDIPAYERDPYEWIPPLDDPANVAIEALDQLAEMVREPETSWDRADPQFSNRLVFAGAVSVLEAYLGDTMVRHALDEPTVRQKLATKNTVLRDIKVSLAELASNPDVLTKRVTAQLRQVMYHQLKAVIAIYRDAFDIELVEDAAKRDQLFEAVRLRHLCVHRNGQDDEGDKLHVFDAEYVGATVALIRETVVDVEHRVRASVPSLLDRLVNQAECPEDRLGQLAGEPEASKIGQPADIEF